MQFVVEQKDFTVAITVILCFSYIIYIYSFFFILFILQFLLLIWLIDLFFFLNIEYISFLIYIIIIDILKFLIVSLIINRRSVLRKICFLNEVYLITVFTVIASSWELIASISIIKWFFNLIFKSLIWCIYLRWQSFIFRNDLKRCLKA